MAITHEVRTKATTVKGEVPNLEPAALLTDVNIHNVFVMRD